MLMDARMRHSRKKITRATATTLKTSNSLMSNPEVEAFYDKLGMITEELPEMLFNPLNLIQWGRTKYRPTDSENRIRIENRISLKRAADEKMRPRVKPIKRISQSVELLRNEPSLSYLEFYKQLMRSQSFKNSRAQDQESEQEQPLEAVGMHSRDEGFRFKSQLKKYNNEKVQSKVSEDKIKQPSSKFNRSPATKYSNTSKTIIGRNEGQELKINSILKKWKPANRVERKFEGVEGKAFQRRRLSCKDVSKPVELLMDTYREERQSTNSDYLVVGKKEC